MQLFFETAGQGPPLVILHGLFGSSDNWRSVAKPLTQHYTVYFVDLRNHGRSPHAPTHSYAEMAADLGQLMDDQGLAQAVVLGHSMGGKVVMTYAFAQSHRVSALIVADMGMRQYPAHHDAVLRALHNVQLGSIATRQEADAQLAEYLADDASTRQFLLKSLYRPEGGGFAWRFNLPVLTAEYDKILQAVGQGADEVFHGPTLFVTGARSHYVQPADHAGIRLHFSDIRFVPIPDAGHWVHAEQPQAFMAALLQFLGHGA